MQEEARRSLLLRLRSGRDDGWWWWCRWCRIRRIFFIYTLDFRLYILLALRFERLMQIPCILFLVAELAPEDAVHCLHGRLTARLLLQLLQLELVLALQLQRQAQRFLLVLGRIRRHLVSSLSSSWYVVVVWRARGRGHAMDLKTDSHFGKELRVLCEMRQFSESLLSLHYDLCFGAGKIGTLSFHYRFHSRVSKRNAQSSFENIDSDSISMQVFLREHRLQYH